MKVKTFLSKDKTVVATAIAQFNQAPDTVKVYVHWNYTISQEQFSDGEFGSPATDEIYTAICKWCDDNNYELWSY